MDCLGLGEVLLIPCFAPAPFLDACLAHAAFLVNLVAAVAKAAVGSGALGLVPVATGVVVEMLWLCTLPLLHHTSCLLPTELLVNQKVVAAGAS